MKRSKRTRIRGRGTAGWGTKKHRGKGSSGGKGVSGTGKKAGQKRTFVLRYFERYFGKHGFVPVNRKRLIILNVGDISKNIEKWLKEDKAKKTGEGIEINLKGFKILSKGEVSEKLIITASAASENSKKKVEKAGGKIILK